jgi:acyl transferase domain-containing protein
VQFEAGIRASLESGYTHYLEIGPHPVLIAMGQEIPQATMNEDLAPPITPIHWYGSLEKEKNSAETLLESVGGLFTRGIEIDWKKFEEGYFRKKVRLPTYPFQRKKYWVDTGKLKAEKLALSINQIKAVIELVKSGAISSEAAITIIEGS